jgi:hypothetical protein
VTAGTLAYDSSQHSSLILPVTQSSLRRATAFLFELRYREHRHVRASVLMCVHGIRRGLSKQGNVFPCIRSLEAVWGSGAGLGYENPSFGAEGGIETNVHRFLSVTSAEITRAQKVETGDGTLFHLTSDDYVRVGGFLIGGGARWAKQQTSQWSKSAWRPRIAFGYELPFARLTSAYMFSGTDHRNGGWAFDADVDFFLGQHWRCAKRPRFSYFPTDQPSAPREHGANLKGRPVTFVRIRAPGQRKSITTDCATLLVSG